MKWKLLLIGFVVLAVVAWAMFSFFRQPALPPGLHHLVLTDERHIAHSIVVEYAITPEQMERGLMGRNPVKNGMLFLFADQSALHFWMKNTLVPLNIAFFDRNGRFVNALTMTPCTQDPCAVYDSAGPAQYALELPVDTPLPIAAGWTLNVPHWAPLQ